jgi:hypothetical protein
MTAVPRQTETVDVIRRVQATPVRLVVVPIASVSGRIVLPVSPQRPTPALAQQLPPKLRPQELPLPLE